MSSHWWQQNMQLKHISNQDNDERIEEKTKKHFVFLTKIKDMQTCMIRNKMQFNRIQCLTKMNEMKMNVESKKEGEINFQNISRLCHMN